MKNIKNKSVKPTVIKIGKNPKMKTIDLQLDRIDKIIDMVQNLCSKSFDDGGIVNDADLDDIREQCMKLIGR